MAKDKRIKREDLTDLHTIRTYEFLYFAAHYASVDAKEADDEPDEEFHYTDRFIYCLMTIVFCAFALEGHLNHLGITRFTESLWQHLERLTPEGKLDILAKDLGVTIDKSRRPFQTFRDIIRFRNALAHGKTHVTSDPIFVDDKDYALFEKPEWMKFCTLENAEQCKKDTMTMINQLHKKAGIEVIAIGSYGASLPKVWKPKDKK